MNTTHVVSRLAHFFAPFVLHALLILTGLPLHAAGDDDWILLDPPTTRDLRRLEFTDSMHGWAVGDSGTIIMTADGGENWVVQNSGTEFDIVDISMVDAVYGWALAQEYPVDTILTYGTDLIRTTDGGQTWFFERRFDDFYYFAVDFMDSANGLLAGNSGRILWTEDGGVSWTPAVIDSPDFARWTIYRFHFYDSLYGIAMGGQFDVTGLVWKTTDGGKFWDHYRVAGEPVFGGCFLDSLNILCVSGDLDIGSGMVRTTNAGENWAYTYLGIWGQATSVSFRTPAEGWATLGFASTFMVTTDSGNTWTSMFTPDSSQVFDVVFLDSTKGFIVGNYGTIFKYAGPPVPVQGGETPLPDRFHLHQNYPNPFNPGTTIEYDLSVRSTVEVTVVDMTGREVARYDLGMQSPGRHHLLFEANTLATGIYFCRVSIDPADGPPHSGIIKMLLLR
jgi:photosystem II stability/assembly factor-like uncharacterized protein